ncbi:MAG: GNAT family N-acetyltransferase [Promethearchaeati archaeon SRVP18_Atabeyarchaeia-1]
MSELPPAEDAKVTLRRINGKTVRRICNLGVSEDQRNFVAPNAVSIAQAYFNKTAWFRAIYADTTPVGFLMLSEVPKRGFYYLWRFMIDAKYQGKGYGRKALELVIKRIRKMPKAKALYLSVVRAKGSAEDFYKSFGFEFTGRMDGVEYVMKLAFGKQ